MVYLPITTVFLLVVPVASFVYRTSTRGLRIPPLDAETAREVVEKVHVRDDPVPQWIAGGREEEIVKIGQMAQITYDVFPNKKIGANYPDRHEGDTAAMNKYGMKFQYKLSQKEERVEYNFSDEFKVDRMLYSRTLKSKVGHTWCGYVAVERNPSHWDGKDIVVCWRGTQTASEWAKDAQVVLEPWRTLPASEQVNENGVSEKGNVIADIAENLPVGQDLAVGALEQLQGDNYKIKVHGGFQSLYNRPAILPGIASAKSGNSEESPRQTVIDAVRRLCSKNKIRRVLVTGHSLGAALALLNAYDLSMLPGGPKVEAITFACPKVGNGSFKRDVDLKLPHNLRVYNKHDIVPKVPSGMGQLLFSGRYEHPGTPFKLDSQILVDEKIIRKDKYKMTGLFFTPDLATIGKWHNLELYLRMIGGPRGKDELMNKSDDILSVEVGEGIEGSWAMKRFTNPQVGSTVLNNRSNILYGIPTNLLKRVWERVVGATTNLLMAWPSGKGGCSWCAMHNCLAFPCGSTAWKK